VSVYKRCTKTGRTVKDNQPGTWGYNFYHKGKRYIQSLPGITSKAEAKAIEQAKRFEVYSGITTQQETQRTIQKLTDEVAALKRQLESKDSNKAGDREILFEKFADVFFAHKRIAYKQSVEQYQHMVKLYKKHFSGRMLHAITTADIEAFRQTRADEPTRFKRARAKATLDLEIAILSGLFTMAIEQGYIRSNPCAGVKLYKPKNRRLAILEEDRDQDFFNAFTGAYEKYKPVATLYLHTGLRLRELSESTWENVRLGESKKERKIEVLGKGRKWRTVPLNDTAYGVLKDLRAKCKGKGKVFAKMSAVGIANAISTTFDKIGLPGLTTHTLRHTFATRLARRGDVNAEQLRVLLGHSNIATTQRYFHLDDESLCGAVGKLDFPVDCLIAGANNE
jgi:integrase